MVVFSKKLRVVRRLEELIFEFKSRNSLIVSLPELQDKATYELNIVSVPDGGDAISIRLNKDVWPCEW
ncbi:hypothetical protein PHLCEN_2v7939 [Hermanssonia centrifuga]|uniref:Uncharacterized protein n=1 Tax=Hermanssonia centrifuga TaxID=98765 RepID=A0A2R6NV36_9APHY|nr:hypothetical protein PHLCEN_2v7939 [Hermanssonia centrifuga]